MTKIVLTFGLIAGTILAIMMIVAMAFQDAIGFDKGEIVGYTTMVVAFLLIYFGIRSYRDNVAGGSVSFGRALGVGLLIMVVASLCYVTTWEIIYFSGSAGDFAAKYQAHALEKAQADGATPAEMEKKRAEFQRYAEMYENPAINAAVTFLEPLPVGLVFAIVSAIVLSRRRRAPVAVPVL